MTWTSGPADASPFCAKAAGTPAAVEHAETATVNAVARAQATRSCLAVTVPRHTAPVGRALPTISRPTGHRHGCVPVAVADASRAPAVTPAAIASRRSDTRSECRSRITVTMYAAPPSSTPTARPVTVGPTVKRTASGTTPKQATVARIDRAYARPKGWIPRDFHTTAVTTTLSIKMLAAHASAAPLIP